MPAKLSVNHYQANILKFALQHTTAEKVEGFNWYFNAYLQCLALAKKYNLDIDTTAAIVAALSPQTYWERNLQYAEQLITTRTAPVYGINVTKGCAVLDGMDPNLVLNGDKVMAFYRLLRSGGNEVDVCLDSIAILIALGKKPGKYTNKDAGYIFDKRNIKARMVSAYMRCANELSVRPCDLQAMTWVMWRNRR